MTRIDFMFMGRQCCAYKENPFKREENKAIADEHLKLFGKVLCVGVALHDYRPIADIFAAEIAMVALERKMRQDADEEIEYLVEQAQY